MVIGHTEVLTPGERRDEVFSDMDRGPRRLAYVVVKETDADGYYAEIERRGGDPVLEMCLLRMRGVPIRFYEVLTD